MFPFAAARAAGDLAGNPEAARSVQTGEKSLCRGSLGVGPGAEFPYTRKQAPAEPATGERFLRLRKSDLFLAALLAAGAATFLYALFRRKNAAGPFPYARPEGGEREGEFELFIGS